MQKIHCGLKRKILVLSLCGPAICRQYNITADVSIYPDVNLLCELLGGDHDECREKCRQLLSIERNELRMLKGRDLSKHNIKTFNNVRLVLLFLIRNVLQFYPHNSLDETTTLCCAEYGQMVKPPPGFNYSGVMKQTQH